MDDNISVMIPPDRSWGQNKDCNCQQRLPGKQPAQPNAFMPTANFRAILIVLVIVGVAPQRVEPRHFQINANSVTIAAIALAEAPASIPSFQASTRHELANQFNLTKPWLSEPLLLLLMGALLITVGASIRRLTRSRHQPRAVETRQT